MAVSKYPYTALYALIGACFGLLFPIMGMIILLILQAMPFTLSSLIELQRTEPLLWIIDTAPLFLGLFAMVAGIREDNLRRVNAQLQQNEQEILQLQQRLAQLVEVRNVQMSVGVDVNRYLSEILDLQKLLEEAVDQVKDRLGYYYAHIYLFDDEQENLLMTAGSGPVGEMLKTGGHKIAIDSASLVARSARSGKVVLVDRVQDEPDWLPNELLPDTCSEMAVPIVLEGRVVGVLDVQQDKVAGFDQGDANLLRSVADQVAVAIRNARLFEEVQAKLVEANAIQQKYIEDSWREVSTFRQNVGQVRYSLDHATTLADEVIAQARRLAMASQEPALVALNDHTSKAGEAMAAGPVETSGSGYALVAPILLQNVAIGNLQLHEIDPNRKWTENELAIIEAI
ncbi:MAG: GAF domain-containing protein, partial [Anaerolineae bacterium]|nr:GAF domain-containing protein [Anaerolineae bacterium]